ncbi:hypothetical protein [Pseudosulfitobacter pseudonitzschiae]|uniref:hypothetical protein n=1 Tax=Pseudosulfitobacter pseudonitzschiae TaxID=1402135 RepID=UPI001AF33C1F|nr:hypothetical protein [Pseudosulfitobacter pseudonitzschiae]MBM1814438.1 hypothetical protein [Pseudosulfitobacter pseudonitzschiae]MBM1831431.1 hypothetical protein [Pseudosulfitobacter pseudonitzschiae]MBM1836298.1 hypothetical protein [Pseudosulfitobacter pseudonitzschiae]MBM1841144.1 hypothetical protein [Pseudosulfitobacter pseudonitzschiae]MBM1846012.1 hypothetical protein [Pseudosulfitobacter pseudonitzschiae]
MAAKKNITVTREKPTGLNTHFNVPGQGEVTRGELARQVGQGRHEGYHTRKLPDGRTIVASNPDGSDKNNLG